MERIPENIAKKYEGITNPRTNRRAIFKHYRGIDDSRLAPISGKFNVTERAIRHLWKFERESGDYLLGLELTLFLDMRISEIVNSTSF